MTDIIGQVSGPDLTVTGSSTVPIIDWPRGLYSGSIRFSLISQTRGASESLSGQTLITKGLSQLWHASMSTITLPPHLVRDARAMIAEMRGREMRARLPVRDRYDAIAEDDGLPGVTQVFFRRGQRFANGRTFVHRGPQLRITCNAGDTSFSANATMRRILGRGVYFGVGDDLYITRRPRPVDNPARIHFEPAARRDYVRRDITLRPYVIMRLADDDVGGLDLTDGYFGSTELRFIEDPR